MEGINRKNPIKGGIVLAQKRGESVQEELTNG